MIKTNFVFLCMSLSCISAQSDLLFIDTANYDHYYYNTFITLAKSAGFTVDYKPWHEIKKTTIDPYRAIVIALDSTLYNAINHDTIEKNRSRPVALQHMYALLHTISQAKNKLIFFLVPGSRQAAYLTKLLLERMQVIDNTKYRTVNAFLEQFLKRIMVSDAYKSYWYDTALLPKHEKSWWKQWIEQIKYYVQSRESPIKKIDNNKIIVAHLPAHQGTIDARLEPILPLALYLYNAQTNNHFIISTLNNFGFADIKEHFILNPVDPALREQLFSQLQTIVNETYALAMHDTLAKTIQTKPLPFELRSDYERELKNLHESAGNPLLCGWMNIEPFLNKPEFVPLLFTKELTLLWIQLSPEFFMADRASKAVQKDEWLKRVTQFVQLLDATSKQLNKPVPQLFFGVEMTGNFTEKNVPSTVHDMYGQKYTKIPSPLDFEQWWQPEVLVVIDRFMDFWKKNCNQIPLSGIFFDFEMYHAQDQTGQFMSTMDFSDCAWNLFSKTKPNEDLEQYKTVDERVQYLLAHKLMTDYFLFLKEQAKTIGSTIGKYVQTHYPELKLAAYNISLPYNWFYQGICAGLSSCEKPLLLATFNNCFYNHLPALVYQQIYATHMPVLLLSKLKNESDFAIIDALMPYNDGIWLNKISRLAQSQKKKDWEWDWGVETTPLEPSTVMAGLSSALAQYSNS